MRIARKELLRLVENLPETVEIEEVLYRLSLRKRLEAAEEEIREGRVLSEDEVAAEIAQWPPGSLDSEGLEISRASRTTFHETPS